MLTFQNVSFQYQEDAQPMLRELSFQVEDGEFVSVIGHSGCGKSTIFRLVNRLLEPQGGEIFVDGKNIRAQKNYCGYMPQQDLLFPWRTVADNVRLPLEIRGGMSKAEMNEKVQSTLQTVGLPFVGADTRTGAITCDKSICKTLVQAAGIPVTPFVTWRMGDSVQAARRAIAATFGSHPYPLFLKPTSLGSSVGVCAAESHRELVSALTVAFTLSERAMIEPYLTDKRELECGY